MPLVVFDPCSGPVGGGHREDDQGHPKDDMAVAAAFSLVLMHDSRLVGLAMPMGVMIAAGAVGRSLGLPIEQLPKDA